MKTPMVRIFNLTRSRSEFQPQKTAQTPGSPRTTPMPVASEQQHADAAALIEQIERERMAAQLTRETSAPEAGPAHSGKMPASPERRHRRRVKISAPVRVRQSAACMVNEFDVTMTMDVSREGLLFETTRTSYVRGQELAVVFPYRPTPGEKVKEQRAQVVRVSRASEKRHSVAVAFLEGEPEMEVVDSLGRPLQHSEPVAPEPKARRNEKRPVIIIADHNEISRASLRVQLEREGYRVEAVASPGHAIPILRHRSPAALICDAEPLPGAMPDTSEISGYDLCVVIRRNPKFSRIPVLLTTRTALPSDFATAHALGATVCVAKPYDLDRIANLMRMLVPVNEE